MSAAPSVLPSKPNFQQAVPFFLVANMEASLRFYVDGVGFTIYFICRDALAIHLPLKARGVQPSRPFIGNAMWVTSLTDPDGFRIDFESPTEAPEESVLEGELASPRIGHHRHSPTGWPGLESSEAPADVPSASQVGPGYPRPQPWHPLLP